MKILGAEVKGERLSLGSFVMDSDTAVVTDPCYKLGTWCQAKVENVLQGTWKGHVYQQVDEADLRRRDKYIADLKEKIKKATLDLLIETYEERIKELREASFGRISLLMAHHESINPFVDFDNEWKAIDEDIGVDSGQMSISPLSSWATEEISLEYEGPETPNAEYPAIPHRGSTGPYWKVCDITCGPKSAGVFDNRAVVSSSGYGDGSYIAFTLSQNDKVVGIAVVFIPDWNDVEDENTESEN